MRSTSRLCPNGIPVECGAVNSRVAARRGGSGP
jgi:hypothetical protein